MIATRLLLIRHAPTSVTGRILIGRLPGYSLSEEGRGLADKLSGRLSEAGIRAVYTSPLERARETAETLARYTRRHPIDEPRLIEVDYGSWTGRSLSSLSRLKAWQTVRWNPSLVVFPSGESLVGMQARALAACTDIARRHRLHTVALVTHADIIKAVIAHFAGVPLDFYHRFAVASPSVSVIDLPDAGAPRIVTVNGGGDSSTWR